MFFHLPPFIQNYKKRHKDVLKVIFGQSFSTFSGALVYGILPAYLLILIGEINAGIFIGAFNLIAAFLINPLAGLLADKISAKKVILIGVSFFLISGLILIFLPLTFISMIFFSFFYFSFYAFLMSEVYILRKIKKKEGGFIFGLADNIYSFFYLVSSLAIPYFAFTSRAKLAGALIILTSIIHLSFILFIKKDITNNYSRKFNLNPFRSFKNAIHFIKKNKNYPQLILGASLFQGFFYGTIWFVFPLYLVSLNEITFFHSLLLGIYELVTILIAGFSGYLADKTDWRKMQTIGWLLIVFGTLLMPFNMGLFWLIFFGAVIAIGNNFEYYSAQHALEEHDIDHEEDGSFIALNKTFLDIGYAISPVVAGIAYVNFGFASTLVFNIFVCIILAAWMLSITWRKRS